MATKLRPDRVVDEALTLAREVGWDDVRLDELARRLGVTLADIAALFRDRDAIADHWFAKARDAMLRLSDDDVAGKPPPERLELALTTWLDALAPHREVSADMIRTKLYVGHPQHWVPLVFDLSRLVHWLLDAARIEGTGRLRQIEEIGLTMIVLATLRDWMRDTSEEQGWTRRRLRARLNRADWLLRRRHMMRRRKLPSGQEMS